MLLAFAIKEFQEDREFKQISAEHARVELAVRLTGLVDHHGVISLAMICCFKRGKWFYAKSCMGIARCSQFFFR